MYIRNGALVIFSEVKAIFKIKRGKFRKSLFLVLFIALALIGSVPVIAVNRLLIATSVGNELSSRIARIQNQWMIVADQVSHSGYMENPQNEVVDSELSQMAALQDGRALVVNSAFKIVKDTYEIDTGKYNISELVIKCMKQGEALTSTSLEYLEFVQPVYSSNGSEIVGCVLLTSSRRSLNELSDKLGTSMYMYEIVAICLIVLISGLLAGYLVRPLKKIADSLIKAAENPLGSEDLKDYDYTEIGRISDAYNNTVRRLRTLDESRAQFVSNVSHELKTPITSIRVLADSLTNQEDIPVEIYREFMVDISEEIERESQIIEDLLTLVRLDKASMDLNVTQININDILEATLKRLRPIAIQKNVELVLESFRPVLAEIDKTKFSLAVTNLVENAIKYNVRDGWVKVSLNADHKFFYVKVADSGIGIPDADQEKVFERFYRVDKARSREMGGTGLGLAITKSIIQAHHGAIKIYSKENEGTTFTVRIPLIYIE